MATPTPTTTSLIAGLDTHFMAVKARIAAVNPSRVVVGPMAAQDWPQQQLQFQAFYMLELGAMSFGGTPTLVRLDHTVQWSWVIAGTDVTAGVQSKSRGDRYRISGQMRAEIVNALYPYFSPKLVYSANADGSLSSVALADGQAILWTQPVFRERVDEASGLVYDTATVHLSNLADAVLQ
ncbi:MAG: hypothetical protein KGL39_13605 [Patescibacteria group bacterium]|nr:hypothetical protein [Patescibacteria group bacterium]